MNWNVTAGLFLVIVVGGLYGAAMHHFFGGLIVASLVWITFLFGRKYGMQEQERTDRARRAQERLREPEPERVSTVRGREQDLRGNRELWLPHEDRRN